MLFHVSVGFLWVLQFPHPPKVHSQVANSSIWIVLTKLVPDLEIGLWALHSGHPLLHTFCSGTLNTEDKVLSGDDKLDLNITSRNS